MKKLLKTTLLICCLALMGQAGFAQKALPLRELTSTSRIFLGQNEGEYFQFLTLTGHDVKVGDMIDAVDQAGNRMSFKITKIEIDHQTVDILRTGQEGMIDLKVQSGTMRPFGGDFYLVDAGAPYPAAAADAGPTVAEAHSITAQLGGLPWKAFVVNQGALFYPRGNTMGDPSGKPFLQLAFKSAKAPDDRQLTIQVHDFSAKTGTVDQEQCEILLSGSVDGIAANSQLQGYMNKGAYKKYVFTLKITKWERVSSEKAIISATFSGKLKGTLDSPDIVVNNGAIDDLEVKIL